MSDDVRLLSAELARDPASLAFLDLGEALRSRGELDAAATIALAGLERHPNLPDAHDLYARILVDHGDLERAQDEWGFALRVDTRHVGALKGLGFLCFRRGDLDTALEHLENALGADPMDATVVQALQTVRMAAAGGGSAPKPSAEPARARPVTPAAPTPARAPSPAPASMEIDPAERPAAAVFAGLEGGDHGLLLVDRRGRVLAGAYHAPDRSDASQAVAAYLAGVSQEAERTARLLDLGAWQWIVAEGSNANLQLTQPTGETLLLLVRDRSVPSGRLSLLADRAGEVARRWLAAQDL